jgi:hypothetical protein
MPPNQRETLNASVPNLRGSAGKKSEDLCPSSKRSKAYEKGARSRVRFKPRDYQGILVREEYRIRRNERISAKFKGAFVDQEEKPAG